MDIWPRLLCSKNTLRVVLVFTLTLTAISVSPAWSQTTTNLTQHNDNARTGANLQETILSTNNVVPGRFGKLFRPFGRSATVPPPLPRLETRTDAQKHVLPWLSFSATMVAACCPLASGQAMPQAAALTQNRQACPRRAVGSIVNDPPDLRSEKGLLKVALTIRNSVDSNGHVRYCYFDEHGNPAPTLRLQPGDTLTLTLKNDISLPLSDTSTPKTSTATSAKNAPVSAHDPCATAPMTHSSTNLHFHGLAIPPVCHQDETLKTMIQPGDFPFEYRIQIPENQPPGLYWYHPHVHGFNEEQVLGGASGALIVEGMEHAQPQVAGLPERVFVIRDEKMPDASSSEKPDPNRPTKALSINYIPVPYPNYPPAVIRMKPSERQLWRLLNAAADTYLDLRVEYNGKPQKVSIIALDGVPLRYEQGSPQDYALGQTEVFLPPGGRAEFILTGPPEGVSGLLLTNYVYRGAGDDSGPGLPATKNANPAARVGQDDVDPVRPLATLIAGADVPKPWTVLPMSPTAFRKPGLPPLSAVRPARVRTLYFSERLVDPGNPKSATLFFITEEGHTPAAFDPRAVEPNIIVHQGEVEDWIIENRSQESHVFHIHQLHFLVIGMRAVSWEEPTLRDTINLPAWDGFSRLYPSVRLRMDFRDPNIVGTFPFHCHVMQHVDGGMMGIVRVEPPP